MLEITMPLRTEISEALRKKLNATIAAGQCGNLIVQMSGPRTKRLSDCLPEDLAQAEDVIFGPASWCSFTEWGNPLIGEFVKSGSTVTLGEWLKQKASVAGMP